MLVVDSINSLSVPVMAVLCARNLINGTYFNCVSLSMVGGAMADQDVDLIG